jgi:hypothetical protein
MMARTVFGGEGIEGIHKTGVLVQVMPAAHKHADSTLVAAKGQQPQNVVDRFSTKACAAR